MTLAPDEMIARLARRYGPLPARPRREPLAELLLTVLSQNTSDANSGRAFQSLRERFGTWEALAAAEPGEIAATIQVGGLARVKAYYLKAILGRIQGERGGFALGFLRDLPLAEARAWLRGLPGVGAKTAACVLLFSLDRPALPVDTHVLRVARRLGLVPPKLSAEKAHPALEALLSPEQVYPFHVYLVAHGRGLCRARRPRCPECPLRDGCPTGEDPGEPSRRARHTPTAS